MKKITKSTQETKQLAKKLANKLQGGEVLALVGDLGAGKTTFTQGLAEFFGASKEVSSPTFTLVNDYEIKISKSQARTSKKTKKIKLQNSKNKSLVTSYPPSPRLRRASKLQIIKLIHVDCYRLDSPQELTEIGFEDYLNRKDIVVIIEWAEKIKNILPPKTRWIYFEHSDKEDQRTIKLDIK